jgi:hypothetical protein
MPVANLAAATADEAWSADMSRSSPFVVGEVAGFTPEMGRLVSMMTYVRRTTLQPVAGLSVAQLDAALDAESNTIGALLSHIAAVEVAYQLATFDRRGFTVAEQERWGAALELGARARRAISGRPLEHYAAQLDEVRARTLAELARRDDACSTRRPRSGTASRRTTTSSGSTSSKTS